MNRVVVGAHYGLRGWLVQRISAIVMTLYTVAFLVALAAAKPVEYGQWKALFSQGWMRLATLLFFVSLLGALAGGVLALVGAGGTVSLVSLGGLVAVLGVAGRHDILLVCSCRSLEQVEGDALGT